MKRYAVGLLALGCIGLSACTSAQIKPLKRPDQAQQATVTIYRNSEFHGGGLSMIVGVDNQDVVELENNEITTFHLAPGSHDFYVRSSQGDVPLHLSVTLNAKQLVCMKGGPHDFTPAEFIPFYAQTRNAFILATGDCPAEGDLAKYKPVSVNYIP